MTIFSDNLTRMRKASKIPRAQIAEVLNISISAYGMYEQGRHAPDLEKLVQLAKIFSCSVDDLLGVAIGAEEAYAARLAEIGLTIEYKDNQATIMLPNKSPIQLGEIKKADLAEDIKKALADYDKDTAAHKAEYISAKLEAFAADRKVDKIRNSDWWKELRIETAKSLLRDATTMREGKTTFVKMPLNPPMCFEYEIPETENPTDEEWERLTALIVAKILSSPAIEKQILKEMQKEADKK